jgi:hypothetical protein
LLVLEGMLSKVWSVLFLSQCLNFKKINPVCCSSPRRL